MDFVVEDGTGKPDATSYIDGAFVIAYAVATGATIPPNDPQAAAVAGALWLDATYGARYPGTRKLGRGQGLAYPRVGGYDREGNAIPDDVVPMEIMRANAAAALRHMAAAGSLSPDATGPAVKREQLGAMQVEYAAADGQQLVPRFPEIDGILASLLGRPGGTVAILRA